MLLHFAFSAFSITAYFIPLQRGVRSKNSELSVSWLTSHSLSLHLLPCIILHFMSYFLISHTSHHICPASNFTHVSLCLEIQGSGPGVKMPSPFKLWNESLWMLDYPRAERLIWELVALSRWSAYSTSFITLSCLGRIGFRGSLSHSNRAYNGAGSIIVRVGLLCSLAISVGRSTVYKDVWRLPEAA